MKKYLLALIMCVAPMVSFAQSQQVDLNSQQIDLTGQQMEIDGKQYVMQQNKDGKIQAIPLNENKVLGRYVKPTYPNGLQVDKPGGHPIVGHEKMKASNAYAPDTRTTYNKMEIYVTLAVLFVLGLLFLLTIFIKDFLSTFGRRYS